MLSCSLKISYSSGEDLMLGIIEVWHEYKQDLDFKKLQLFARNNVSPDQDSLVLFFQKLTQQLPGASFDKECDALTLYNILVAEDLKVSELKSYHYRTNLLKMAELLGQNMGESSREPEQPYGLSPDAWKVIYRLAITLFIPDESISSLCENNDLAELGYLQRIPQVNRQYVLNEFRFLLAYEHAIKAIYSLYKDEPERKVYIMTWLPSMFDPTKPIHKGKKGETWNLSLFVNAIFLIKEFFPNDTDNVLQQSLTLIPQLSHINQKVLSLQILQYCSVQDIPLVISHINNILRNVPDEENSDENNLRTRLINTLLTSIKNRKEALLTIFPFLESLGGDTAKTILDALNYKQITITSEVIDKLKLTIPLFQYITPSWEMDTFLKSILATELKELKQLIPRLIPLLKNREIKLQTTFPCFKKILIEHPAQVDDLIDLWLGEENQANCAPLVFAMKKIECSDLISILGSGRVLLDTHHIKVYHRVYLLEEIVKLIKEPEALKMATHLLQRCQDEDKKASFLRVFAKLSAEQQRESFNTLSPLLDTLPGGEERVTILTTLIKFNPAIQLSMLSEISRWIEGFQDPHGKHYIINSFSGIQKENTQQTLIYLQNTKVPNGSHYVMRKSMIDAIARIDHEVHQNIVSRLRPTLPNQTLLLPAATQFAIILGRDALQKSDLSSEQRRERTHGFFTKVLQGNPGSFDKTDFHSILESIEESPSVDGLEHFLASLFKNELEEATVQFYQKT